MFAMPVRREAASPPAALLFLFAEVAMAVHAPA